MQLDLQIQTLDSQLLFWIVHKMVSFKTYIQELYTIGHTRSYDATFNRAKRNAEIVKKDPKGKAMMGPLDTVHTKMKGGAAYQTVDHAKKAAGEMAKSFPGKNYSVYKLKGEFNKNTVKPTKHGYHELNKNTEISHKVD